MTRRFGPDAVRKGQPVGVWIAVHPDAASCLRDPEHPLDEPGQVRLITPSHAQPQVPRIRVHTRQVRSTSQNANTLTDWRPPHEPPFARPRLLQVKVQSPLMELSCDPR